MSAESLRSGGFVREKMRAFSRVPALLRVVQRELQKNRARTLIDKPLEELTFHEFCRLLQIRTKDGAFQSFAPEFWHPEQLRFDRERTGRDIVLKPRQVGFSTLELARDLWFALHHRGAQVLIVVHDGELAGQLFEVLRLFADSLKEMGLLPPTRYSNKRELVFRRGSAVRIVEAGGSDESAGKKGRSGTVNRLHATELAFWHSAHETMRAVLSSVPKGGEVVEESTPNGVGGLFHEDVLAARTRDTGFKLHFFAWYDHPHYRLPLPQGFDPTPRDQWEGLLRRSGVDDEQIAWWRLKVDDPKFGLESALQEFPVDIDTCFRVSGTAWFAGGVLDELARKVRPPLREHHIVWLHRRFDSALIYEEPKPGDRYVVFADVAEGVSNDGSSVHVLERKSGRTVATWWANTIEPGDFAYVLVALGWMYSGALVGWERNNHGHATTRVLVSELRYPHLYYDQDGRPGWNTTAASRPVMWDELAHAIRDRIAYTPDAATFTECRTLIRDDDGRPRARGKRGGGKDAARDDRFVSWAGAWQLRSQPENKVIQRSYAGI